MKLQLTEERHARILVAALSRQGYFGDYDGPVEVRVGGVDLVRQGIAVEVLTAEDLPDDTSNVVQLDEYRRG